MKIIRRTRYGASLRQFKIIVDGEIIGEIKNGETLDFYLRNESHELFVKCGMRKSEKIEVTNGDIVFVEFNKKLVVSIVESFIGIFIGFTLGESILGIFNLKQMIVLSIAVILLILLVILYSRQLKRNIKIEKKEI